MKNYLKHDEWCIIEEGFHREYNEITESVCSLGNGRMGQRGNFEETFTGKTFKEIMLCTILTKPVWVGGRMVILNISQKY
jgi:trehalose/maltose hydrolase-like predicted phosphorylase